MLTALSLDDLTVHIAGSAHDLLAYSALSVCDDSNVHVGSSTRRSQSKVGSLHRRGHPNGHMQSVG